MKRICFLIAALVLGVCNMMAVPAHPGKVKVMQPDGTMLTIRLLGDEWLHFNTTDDGYSVVKDRQGSYVYAELKEGRLEPTTLVAHDVADRSAKELAYLSAARKYQAPELSETVRQKRQMVEQIGAERRAARRAAQYDYSKFKGLIVLIEYKDKEFSRSDYAELLDDMVNKEDYDGYDKEFYTGSVRDYFSDNSGGKFKPQFDVVGPYQVDYECLEGSSETDNIILSALDQADADVNFKDYDGDGDGFVDLVYFVVAGNGANYDGNDHGLWWPHRSIITEHWDYVRRDEVIIYDYASSTELRGYIDYPSTVDIDGIGTICHEFSHVLGLPDFYDTDYDGSGGQSLHPDGWSLMAGGSYMNDSRTPVGYSLFERYYVGFSQGPEVINAEGHYELEPVHVAGKGYRIDSSVKDEFFLFENRQRNAFKWDEYLPGNGMLVHRVDFTNKRVWSMAGYSGNTVNADPSHNYYEVVRAGGTSRAGTNYDVFPGSGRKTELNNVTSPANLKSWSGESTKWGLSNIAMSGGIVSFDISNTFVLKTLTLPEAMTVGVGLTAHIEVAAEPSYADYTLTWKSGDPSVATVDAQGNVTGIKAGTAVITATSNNGLTASCKVTVEKMTAIDVAEFKQQEVGTDVLLQLQDAEVLYVYENTAYVRDAKGRLVFSDTGIELKKDNIINGSLVVKVGFENELYKALGISGSTNGDGLTITNGPEIRPRQVSLEDLKADDYLDYIIVKAVKLERNNGVWAVSGDRRVRLGNPFAVGNVPMALAGKYFDVECIYGTDVLNDQVIDELYRVKAVVEVPAPTGISEVRATNEDGDAVLYNLQGQRLSGSYKGLIIRNGKKYLNK